MSVGGHNENQFLSKILLQLYMWEIHNRMEIPSEEDSQNK